MLGLTNQYRFLQSLPQYTQSDEEGRCDGTKGVNPIPQGTNRYVPFYGETGTL